MEKEKAGWCQWYKIDKRVNVKILQIFCISFSIKKNDGQPGKVDKHCWEKTEAEAWWWHAKVPPTYYKLAQTSYVGVLRVSV